MDGEVPLDLLSAVLDGRMVDWESVESSASSASQREQIRQLRTLATIATLHREFETVEAQMPAAEAELWGPLRLLERVGEGSFGEVYRAWDTRLARKVALKLFRHRESPGSWSDDRALEEGRLLARIRHPNVVTVFGADRIGDRVGMWMEFVHGRTLHQVLETQGALSAREATAIGLDLCLALSAVHRAGLLHRDVKAQNVIREDGGRIVLMDFGAGRDEHAGQPAELAGTPLYLAPEVFRGAPATVRSDIYSLGVLLYHLVTGSYPVVGPTTADIHDAHSQRRRTWLRDLRPDLSDRFVQAVERALEFDPLDRHESAGAMEAALARVVAASDSETATSVEEAPSSQPTTEEPARGSWQRFTWVAGTALTVAAVVAVVVANRIPGRPGGSSPALVQGVMLAGSSAVNRKVTLSVPGGLNGNGGPSADGKWFSVSDRSGNVVLIELATGEVRRVTNDAVLADTGSQFAEYSVISPDSQRIAYTWWALDGKYELRVVDIEGKRPRVLLRDDTIDYPVPLQWSRDGSQILSKLTRRDLSVQLALVSVEDATIRPIKELGAVSPYYASISPDGQFIVYDAPQQRSSSRRDVFIIGSDGSGERRLIDHPSNDANPVWTPDGTRVLFASDRSGTTDLWSIGVEGGFPRGDVQVAHRNIGRMSVIGLTNAGSLFYEATIGAVDVYEADLIDGVVKNPTALPTSNWGSNLGSVWSPEGGRVAYASRRGLSFDRLSTTLVIRDRQTNEQRELVPSMSSFLPRFWLPDGHHIVTTGVDLRGRWGNYEIDVDTGRATPLVLSDRPSHDNDIGPGYSMPDGRLLYFNGAKHALLARNLQTGAEQIAVDLRAERVEIRGGSYKVSPNGQTLAFTAFTREGDAWTSTIALKDLGAKDIRYLTQTRSPKAVLFQDWAPDGQTLFFTRETPPDRTLWRVSAFGSDPQPLGLSMDGLRDVSVHPDGSKITFTAGWPKKELWVMENFLDTN